MSRPYNPPPLEQGPVAASGWADTQHITPKADLTAPATQIVGDRDAYLGGQGDVGRRTGEDHVELFTTGDVAGALQREFQAHNSEFIALHDIGSSGSLRLLGSLAGSAGVRVQKLSIRRQGHGLALAVLQFVEVPRADGSLMRVYSTDISAEDASRQNVARVMLAFSRLGVLMVGDVSPHAVSTALHPLHQHMSRSVWPNRELLLVPVAGNATLATQGKELAADTPVFVHMAPRAAKPRQVWALIASTWNRQHGAPAGNLAIQSDIAEAVPMQQPPAPLAHTMPTGLEPLERLSVLPLGGELKVRLPTSTPPTQPASASAAAAPPRHVAAAALPSGFARRDSTVGSAPASGSTAQTPFAAHPAGHVVPNGTSRVPMPVPGSTRWQTYAERCLGIKGVVSVCVFDTHSLQALAHAGGVPSAERLAQQGALLMAEMVDVARALGLGSTRPDAAITVGAHHLLLQHVAGHPGIALHLVVQASKTHLTVVRVQLERIEVPG